MDQTPMDSADESRARFPRPARRGEGGKRGEGNALLPFARPELAAEMEQWLEHLGAERRYSPRTLEAYARDVRQLLAFLADHLGKKISLADLKQLEDQVKAIVSLLDGTFGNTTGQIVNVDGGQPGAFLR